MMGMLSTFFRLRKVLEDNCLIVHLADQRSNLMCFKYLFHSGVTADAAEFLEPPR